MALCMVWCILFDPSRDSVYIIQLEIMKSIYDLKLHEFTRDGDTIITRVPGGWIYSTRKQENLTGQVWGNMRTISDVFVPFNNEFKES